VFVIRHAYQWCWEMFRRGAVFVCIARTIRNVYTAHTVEESVLTICLCHCDFLEVVKLYLIVKVTISSMMHDLIKTNRSMLVITKPAKLFLYLNKTQERPLLPYYFLPTQLSLGGLLQPTRSYPSHVGSP
jgi:hypothetical protein